MINFLKDSQTYLVQLWEWVYGIISHVYTRQFSLSLIIGFFNKIKGDICFSSTSCFNESFWTLLISMSIHGLLTIYIQHPDSHKKIKVCCLLPANNLKLFRSRWNPWSWAGVTNPLLQFFLMNLIFYIKHFIVQ
jgi:hypothetical protein